MPVSIEAVTTIGPTAQYEPAGTLQSSELSESHWVDMQFEWPTDALLENSCRLPCPPGPNPSPTIDRICPPVYAPFPCPPPVGEGASNENISVTSLAEPTIVAAKEDVVRENISDRLQSTDESDTHFDVSHPVNPPRMA